MHVRYPWSLLLILLPCLARADEATGRATGIVEARTSSYREQRTDILAPSLDARIDLANGMRVRGHYLLDAITSASVAVDAVASASVGVDPLAHSSFTEHRHEGAVGLGGNLGSDAHPATIDGTIRYSHEPDYRSYSGSLSSSVAFDQRATVLSLATTVTHDEVWQVVRTADPTTGQIERSVVRVDQGNGFDGFVVSLGASRVLSPLAILDAGYEVGFLHGYLGNPYRRVLVDGYVVREHVPSQRLRHTGSLVLRLARPNVRGALHLVLRGYVDDWSIHALTAETRWYQALGPYFQVRGNFRYYTQTAAYFDGGQNVVAPSYVSPVTYTTANPRYAAMRSYEIGFAAVTRLGFLAHLGRSLDQAEIELAFDYRIATNRFGNAIAASFALRVPFR